MHVELKDSHLKDKDESTDFKVIVSIIDKPFSIEGRTGAKVSCVPPCVIRGESSPSEAYEAYIP